jgi:hypothetical protein
MERNIRFLRRNSWPFRGCVSIGALAMSFTLGCEGTVVSADNTARDAMTLPDGSSPNDGGPSDRAGADGGKPEDGASPPDGSPASDGPASDGTAPDGAADPQLAITIAPDNSYVVLENSQIYVKYLPYSGEHPEFTIKEFRIKSAGNENQVGSGTYNYMEAADSRCGLKSATLIHDGTDRKTVRLVWLGYDRGITSCVSGRDITHEVSIFPDSKYIEIDYVNVKYGVNIVDLGSPGGTNAGTHVVHGNSGWIRDYNAYPNSYYNRYAPDGYNDPADAGSLNYNGKFILGVYNPANSRGFARVMPVADISIIKLLMDATHRRGVEIFPHPFFQDHQPFTGYLYVVTGGESEILSVGKQLADGTIN